MSKPKLTPAMEKTLKEAKEYGDWFGISHHPMASVRGMHQTVKALYRMGLLERVERTVYTAWGWPKGVVAQYRIKK